MQPVKEDPPLNQHLHSGGFSLTANKVVPRESYVRVDDRLVLLPTSGNLATAACWQGTLARGQDCLRSFLQLQIPFLQLLRHPPQLFIQHKLGVRPTMPDA
jgi:hypothetical protein